MTPHLNAMLVNGRSILHHLVALVVCLSASLANAQSRSFDPAASCTPAWTPISGSANEEGVLTIATGPDGFTYVAGTAGLHRIEGGRTRSWYPDPAVEGAIPAGSIFALVSEGGGLWMGYSGGLVRFDTATSQFERVEFTAADIKSPPVLSLMQDRQRLLIGTLRGGYYLDLSDRSTYGPLELEGPENRVRVWQFAEFEGRVLAGTGSGLQIETEPGHFERLDLDPESDRPVPVRMLATEPGALWVGTVDGIIRVTSLSPLEYERFTPATTPGLPGGMIEVLTVDDAGTLWFGGWGGLARWRAGAAGPEPCRRWAADTPDVDIPVSALKVLDGSRLVMGTRGSGFRIAPIDTGVTRILTGEPRYGDLPEVLVYSTLVDSAGHLILGASSGLFRERSPGRGSFVSVGEATLGARRIQTLHEHSDGSLWIGTDRGLYVQRDDALSLVPLMAGATDTVGAAAIFDIETYGSRLLVATTRGLVVLDVQSGQPERLFHSKPGERTINDAPVIAELSIPRVWHVDALGDDVYATTSDNVYRIDVAAGTVLASTVAARQAGTLNADRRLGTVATRAGEVFIASGNGIVRTDRDFDTVDYLTSLNGFRLGSVQNIRRAADETIWFTTKLGASNLDPREQSWRLISLENGMHSGVTTQGAMSLTAGGELVLGSAEGASVIPASLIARDESPLRLLAIEPDTDRFVRDGDTRSIGPEQRSYAIEFATPDFVQADRYAIDYTLSSPRQVTSQRLDFGDTLTFEQLEAAEYTLQATIVDATGARSAPLTMTLVVLPFWWETALIYGVAVLLGLLLFTGGLLWRARAARRGFDLVGDERRRIAQDLHDNVLQDVVVARMMQRSLAKEQQSDALREQAETVMGLLSTATDAARTSVRALSDLRDLPPLSEAVRLIDPPMQLEDPVPIVVEESGDPWPIAAERRFFLIRIAQEAVNNACKHAQASEIRVGLRWRRLQLTVDIEDDGKGFEVGTVDANAGFGLAAMHRMARSGRLELSVDSSHGQGTRITVRAGRFRL